MDPLYNTSADGVCSVSVSVSVCVCVCASVCASVCVCGFIVHVTV